MFLRLSQRSFCWRLFAVTQGEMSWYAVWWLPGHPRSAHDATQVTPPVWCNGVATVKTAAHDDFAVGEYHCAVRGITI